MLPRTPSRRDDSFLTSSKDFNYEELSKDETRWKQGEVQLQLKQDTRQFSKKMLPRTPSRQDDSFLDSSKDFNYDQLSKDETRWKQGEVQLHLEQETRHFCKRLLPRPPFRRDDSFLASSKDNKFPNREPLLQGSAKSANEDVRVDSNCLWQKTMKKQNKMKNSLIMENCAESITTLSIDRKFVSLAGNNTKEVEQCSIPETKTENRSQAFEFTTVLGASDSYQLKNEMSKKHQRGELNSNFLDHSSKSSTQIKKELASHQLSCKKDQNILQSRNIKPRRLPPLQPARNRPDSQVLNKVSLSASTSRSSLYGTNKQREVSASCQSETGNLTKSVNYRPIGSVRRHPRATGRLQGRDLPTRRENPLDDITTIPETVRSLDPVGISKVGNDNKSVAANHEHLPAVENVSQLGSSKRFEKNHTMSYRNISCSAGGLTESVRKVYHTPSPPGRRFAVCDDTDLAFRKRMQTRALRKRFEHDERPPEAFLANNNDKKTQSRTLGSSQRLRRVGICGEEALCTRIKLQIMKKRFGTIEETTPE